MQKVLATHGTVIDDLFLSRLAQTITRRGRRLAERAQRRHKRHAAGVSYALGTLPKLHRTLENVACAVCVYRRAMSPY